MERDPSSGKELLAPTDAQLAAAVARRDEHTSSALEMLFARHSEPLLRFVARAVGGAQEAEDIVHDAFIRVAESAGTYRGESPFRTWLFSLALNLVRSQQRRAALKDKAQQRIEMQNAETIQRRTDHDPAWTAQRRELYQKVDESIGKLAEAERETFLLYWFGQLSYAEISAASGITVSAAKVRVHRALSRLSHMLENLK